jgi:hypothetical protein
VPTKTPVFGEKRRRVIDSTEGQPVGREALGQLLVLEGGEVEDDDIVVGDVQVVRQLVSAVRPDAAAMPCGDLCVTLAAIASDNCHRT